MKITVLGGTGRTGRLLVQELLDDGHDLTLLVRDPDKASAFRGRVALVHGDVRDASAIAEAIAGSDAVVSALGPVGRDDTLLRDTARMVTAAMADASVNRYVGVSVAGLVLPGDMRGRRDTMIAWLLNRLGGELAKDKIAEHAIWEASPAAWTLVRVPRLVDIPEGQVEANAHRSGRRTVLARANLARFLADAAASDDFSRAAPFVSDL